MTCWVVIPAKASLEAKSRLAGALDADARANLAEAMLKRAVASALAASMPAGMAIVGKSRLGLPGAIELLTEPEGGLNAAVSSARANIAARGGTRIVTLAADLPQVTASDVDALCTLPQGVIGIAPDRYGTGTNALSLPLPEAMDFKYEYGAGSYALHKSEAARLGLELRLIETPGLARDVDEAADLADAQDLLAPQKG